MVGVFLLVVFVLGVVPLAAGGIIFYFARPHLMKLRAGQRAQYDQLTEQARAELQQRQG